MSKKRKYGSIKPWVDQSTTNNTIFDNTGWKTTYIQRKATIVRSIANAKGKVTISFDGWKANNDVLDLLGVVVHYLGDDYKVHNVVLAMCDTFGSHTGANIADQLFDVLKDYQIKRVTLDLVASRLRCAGHIFNLVCTAILFGVDEHALDDAQYDFSQQHDDSTSGTQAVTSFETILEHGSEEEQHRAWQFKGPVGKLHNLVNHIKANNSRRVVFESKQTEVIDEGDTSHTKILRLVRNGGIRWNSTYLMIERAMHLRDALTLY
ncbi:hypothetical protein Q7P36_002860 [Cladosporium allicinum]